MTAAMYLVDTGDDYVESTLRPADDEWVDARTAAATLFVATNTFHYVFRASNDYRQVRRMLRGKNGKLDARGQGNLFNVYDLQKIVQIRRVIHCPLALAAKVFAAERLGQI